MKERAEKMKVTDEIIYVGVNDHDIDLFEGQYIVPNGMAYNSYVIRDEKIAVMDFVVVVFVVVCLLFVLTALDGAKPEYLIIQHMEPDHSANIEKFMEVYPDTKIVGNAKTFTMISNFFRNLDLEGKKVVVKNQEKLELGKHILTFVFAPMVHWPEVMMTFDTTTGTLFSADAFGTFGALEGALFADEVDFAGKWLDDARRYYTNIVGKYGVQVQAVLKKAATLPIETIAPLHGPVWRKILGWFIG